MIHLYSTIKISHGKEEQIKEISIEAFEKRFQFHYLPQLEFCDYRMEQWLKKKCSHAHKKGRIADYSLWLGHLHKKELSYPILPDISIQFINPSIGYGLFTNQPLEEAQFVGEYAGIVERRNRLFRNTNDYSFMYPIEWTNLRPITINSQRYGNYTRFINHSDDPNMEALAVFHEGIFRILFRTIKPVAADSELTYDYGEFYWRRRKKLIYNNY